MAIYNVFNTEAEAQTACDLDTAKYFADLPTEKVIDGETIAIDNTAYLATTTCFDCPRQRLDGKWVYAKYSNSAQSYTEETYDPSWFYTGE